MMGSKALTHGVLLVAQNDALSDSPRGTVPEDKDHAYGGVLVPPFTEKGAPAGGYVTPTLPGGSVDGGGAILIWAQRGIAAMQKAVSKERT
jgi:hypothetical protein